MFRKGVESIKHIPIDFIKAQIIGLTPEHFTSNILFEEPRSIFRGDTLSKTVFKHKNITIKIFENNNRIEFSGSLHSYYNNGKHNYNDFGFNALKIALNTLYFDLGVKPENLYLIHLEWGFNIKPPKQTNYILNRMIQHKSVNKTVGIDCKIDGKYTQFKHSDYILKTYNKGMHFKLNQEIMRIEIKQTNWSEYRKKGIVTLKDFINTNKSMFLKELLHQWERIIFYDIDNKKTTKYMKYENLNYWEELRLKKSNKNFKYHFDKLKKLNKSIGFNNQEIISNLIIKKGNELQL